MLRKIGFFFQVLALIVILPGCKEEEPEQSSKTSHASHDHDHDSSHAGHGHGHGHDHDHDHGHAHGDDDHHGHDEVDLGVVTIGGLEVELAQGHGTVQAGMESHLVVKLPYSDKGQSIVRAWLGTEDRFQSIVGKGQYAPSHDDYDIHAMAPNPLPANVMWWIEIEKPDGSKLVGSAKPLLD